MISPTRIAHGCLLRWPCRACGFSADCRDPEVSKLRFCLCASVFGGMHDCGLYSIEDMRPINELRMAARWKLGRSLAAKERGGPGGRPSNKEPTTGRSGFWKWVKDVLQLEAPRVVEAQRIGCMPDEEMAAQTSGMRRLRPLISACFAEIGFSPWLMKARILSARSSSSVVIMPPSPHWIGLCTLSEKTPMSPMVPVYLPWAMANGDCALSSIRSRRLCRRRQRAGPAQPVTTVPEPVA